MRSTWLGPCSQKARTEAWDLSGVTHWKITQLSRDGRGQVSDLYGTGSGRQPYTPFHGAAGPAPNMPPSPPFTTPPGLARFPTYPGRAGRSAHGTGSAPSPAQSSPDPRTSISAVTLAARSQRCHMTAPASPTAPASTLFLCFSSLLAARAGGISFTLHFLEPRSYVSLY